MARCRIKETHIILESGESEFRKIHHRVTKFLRSMENQNTNVTKCMRSMEIQNTNVTKCMTSMEIQNTNVTKCMTSMELQNTNVETENNQHKPTHFAEKAATACEMCEHISMDQCSYHSALKFKVNYS